MLKLNKKTEYGLLALKFMSKMPSGQVASAKDIADHYQLPFPLLSKVLQQLKRNGVITSVQGTAGGYVPDAGLKVLTLGKLIACLDRPVSVVDCAKPGGHSMCRHAVRCDLKRPFQILNDRIVEVLYGIRVLDVFQEQDFERVIDMALLNVHVAKEKEGIAVYGS